MKAGKKKGQREGRRGEGNRSHAEVCFSFCNLISKSLCWSVTSCQLAVNLPTVLLVTFTTKREFNKFYYWCSFS